MTMNTRITFNGLSTLARMDARRGYAFIQAHDTTPSIADTVEHEGNRYEVVGVDRADATAGTRRIHIRAEVPKGALQPEPLADWERDLLYGTTGPMPTRDIVNEVLRRGAGKDVLAQLGAQSDRRLRSLLGHAVVLAKQEMKRHHDNLTEKAGKDAITDLGAVDTAAIASASQRVRITLSPLVPEKRQRPSIGETLDALVYYMDADALDGRFKNMVRSSLPRIGAVSPLANGGYVRGGGGKLRMNLGPEL